jgi:predicted signal transduction protein with EAL and GGDEF domain
MRRQHKTSAELLNLFQIAWPTRAPWANAIRNGLTRIDDDGLRSICEAFGETYGDEKSILLESIRDRLKEFDDAASRVALSKHGDNVARRTTPARKRRAAATS